jgi:hypothetical protein
LRLGFGFGDPVKRHRLWTAANGIMAALFVFSAVVQVNDPDPLRWILLYGLAALVCVLEARRTMPWPVAAAAAAVALVAAVLIARDLDFAPVASLFEQWEMRDTSIEETREVGGLLIVAAWMTVVAAVAALRAGHGAARMPTSSEAVAGR